MPRYHVEYEVTVTVGDDFVLPGERPGDQRVVRSIMGCTGRNERHVAKHAFDGWIQFRDMSPPRLIGITLAPPRVS